MRITNTSTSHRRAKPFPLISHPRTNTVVLCAISFFVGVHVNLLFHRSNNLSLFESSGRNLSVQEESTRLVAGQTTQPRFLRFGEEYTVPPTCTEPGGEMCLAPPTATISAFYDKNLYSCAGQCSIHSTCFMGTCLCHPGYTGPTCEVRKEVANPWYTAECPNLDPGRALTYDINDIDIGGNKDCEGGQGRNPCSYLCYSGEEYGSVIIPRRVWQNAQKEEGKVWRRQGQRGNHGDRYDDHFQGFANYKCIPQNLGNVIEFGAGPWTQFRGLLSQRPDVKVGSYTVLEPGADAYIKDVKTCTYKTGKLQKMDRTGFHDFPVRVVSDLGEKSLAFESQYDTVMVTNVIEHVQNAVEFLHGLHKSLKPGGLLIFHDRYYYTPLHGDKVLVTGGLYHPIRPTKEVFDKFLSHFDIVFNNCVGHLTIDGWKERDLDERGYYVVARKK